MHGRIVEQGTFTELLSRGENFSKLVASFGAAQESEEDEGDVIAEKAEAKVAAKRLSKKLMGKAAGTGKLEVSAISWNVVDFVAGSIDAE